MGEVFGWGVVVGMVVMGAMWMCSAATYHRILLHIAKHEGREKLADGNFYYIVPEERYNELRLMEMQQKGQP